MKILKNIGLHSINGKILSFLIVSVLFIGVVTWKMQSLLFVVTIEEEEKEYVGNYASQIAMSVRMDKEDYENFIWQLSGSSTFSRNLSQTFGDDYSEIWESVMEVRALMFESVNVMRGLKRICIYHTNQSFCEDGRYLFISQFQDGDVENLKWKPVENGIYELDYNISRMYNRNRAYISFRIDMNYVFGQYISDDEFMGSYCIFDNDGNYIAGSEKEEILKEFCSLKEGEFIRNEEEGVVIMRVRADKDWNVILRYPVSEYKSDKHQAGLIVFVLLLVYCLIASVLLTYYLQSIMRRLNMIGNNMEEIGNRRFLALKYLRQGDEVSRLEKQYNEMIERLDGTILEMAEMKNKEQQLKIQVLEAQINPHFLYNTLGVMRWKALEAGSRELCEMIDNMTIFYRLALNMGRTLIPVEDEIKLVEAYIAIQQARYDNCVKCDIEVDENARVVLMPKMLIQPLIENIYIHSGIILEGHRRIWIRVEIAGGLLLINVRDNGTGVDEETLYRLNHNVNLSDRHGFGISFIHNALQIYYGSRGRIVFDGGVGKGLEIQIDIPVTQSSALSDIYIRKNSE